MKIACIYPMFCCISLTLTLHWKVLRRHCVTITKIIIFVCAHLQISNLMCYKHNGMCNFVFVFLGVCVYLVVLIVGTLLHFIVVFEGTSSCCLFLLLFCECMIYCNYGFLCEQRVLFSFHLEHYC